MSQAHACSEHPDRGQSRARSAGRAASPRRAQQFETFADSIKRHLQAEVALLRDEREELEPRAYAAGGSRSTIIRIDSSLFTDGPDTRVFKLMLPGLILAQHASLFGCAWPVFTSSPKPIADLSDSERRALAEERMLPGWPPKARWRRREEVLLMLLAPDRREAWRAQLVRPHGEPCTLGHWATLGHEHDWQQPVFRNLQQAIRLQPSGQVLGDRPAAGEVG